jgi:hypothetical protein
MVGIHRPRRRFKKASNRRVQWREINEILDATWAEDHAVMVYLADR